MGLHVRAWAGTCVVATVLAITGPAIAQKSGGILRLHHFDSPASMSILEESTRAAEQPAMAVMNNLVMYDQHVAQNSLQSIVPDLATEWRWSEDGKELTFPLHQGVKWHDGKPFTAADVKCTWDLLMGTGPDKLRINPRKSWYANVEKVTTSGDYEVTFHLKHPQPALLALMASGWSPIYPCHVPAREMRQHPIGTGPFKFVEFKPNEYIKLEKNPDYWKKGRPYLDGIEFTIMKETAPRNLAFFAGKFDAIPLGVTLPTLKDFKEQAPQAICHVNVGNVPRTMLINLHKPPFDNPELRRAMVLALDRKAFNTSSTKASSTPSAPTCCRRRTASGACRWMFCTRCPVTGPMWRRTGPRPARSWRSSATAPTTGSPLRWRRETFRLGAIPPWS